MRIVLALALFPLMSLLPGSEPGRLPVDAYGAHQQDYSSEANAETAAPGKASAEQGISEKARAEKGNKDKTPAERSATPFIVGEQLNYDISWSNFIVAGELTLQTREKTRVEGRDAYYVSAQAQSVGIVKALNYRLNDQYESFVDASSLVPFRGNKISHHGKKVVQSSFAIDPNGHTARMADGRSIEVPKDTYDMASILFAIRGISQTPGSSKTLNVIEDGKLYTVRVEPEAREKVYTRVANYDAFRIAVKMIDAGKPSDAYKIRIFLTRDQQRLPVLITAQPPWGQIRIEMTTHK